MSSKSTIHRRIVAALIAGGAVFAAAACGSSGSDSSSSGATTQETFSEVPGTPATGSPVTVMALAPTDSPEGNHPETYAALQAAANNFNNHGGVAGGHRVDVIYCNDKATATAASQCARDAGSKGVIAVVGTPTVYGDSVNPILEQEGIPNIGGGPIVTSDFSSPISYPLDAGGLANFQGDVFALAKQGKSKLAIVVLDTPTAAPITNSLAAAIKTAKTPDGKPVQLVTTVRIPITASDYTPYAQTLQGAGAEGVIAVESPQQIEGLMKADQSLGNDLTYGCGAGNFSLMDAKAVGQLGKMVGTSDLKPPTGDSNSAKQFRGDMAAAQKAGVKDADNLSYGAFGSWLAMQQFKAVADKVQGQLTSAALLDALKNAKNVDLGDALPGPWTAVDPSRPKALSQLAYSEVYVNKLNSDGTWTLTDPQPLDVKKLLAGG